MYLSPQEQVARQFMEHKGYPDIAHRDVEKLDGQPCWYFLYDLEEGTLELEVSWDEAAQEWTSFVTAFSLASDVRFR